MKLNPIIRIVLFSLGIFILTGMLLSGLGVWTFGFSGDHREETLGSSTFEADPARIQNISIDWVAGDITIVPSDKATQILVAESDVTEKDRMICKVSGSTLTIQFCKDTVTFPSFGISTEVSKELVITVPADWLCDSLEIDAASANVEIRNMTIREMDFDGASGECVLTDCSVGTLDLDAASGDVRFSGVLDSLEFDGASADCTLVLRNCPGHIDMDGMSGDLDLTLPTNCGFTVKMNAMSSDFSSDFETVSRNGSHVHGDGSCQIRIDAMSGNVTIRKGSEACSGDHHH